ncbi:zinc finger protein 507 [Lampris incognitus]|uniref:zinc finger protein 507 n=1 Tax=Lampris incognitus TaxID=2546036 RepID=UPI0024B4CEEE|nr:zinc finger protein 507 [Lampris incognitus]
MTFSNNVRLWDKVRLQRSHSSIVARSCVRKRVEKSLSFCPQADQDEAIQELLQEKQMLHNAHLKENSERSQSAFKAIKAKVQKEIRVMKDNWWSKKAEELKALADRNDMQGLFSALRAIYDPRSSMIAPVKMADGSKLCTDLKEITERWKEHFCTLSNQEGSADPNACRWLKRRLIREDLCKPSTMAEVEKALKDTRNFKDALIVTIYKKKGEQSDCGNHRGISLLLSAGKVLAKIILNWIKILSEEVLTTKIKIYNTPVLPSELYSTERMILYRKHIKKLTSIKLHHLRKLLRIRWEDKVPDVEILRHAGTVSVEALITASQRRWAGHGLHPPEGAAFAVYEAESSGGSCEEEMRPRHSRRLIYIRLREDRGEVMEEISDVAILIAHSSTASSTASAPLTPGSPSQSQTRQASEEEASHRLQQKQAADSLIQVIEKLSKIVEKRPQRRCTLAGQKRAPEQGSVGGGGGPGGTCGSRGALASKKSRRNCKEDERLEEVRLDTWTVAKALSPPALDDSNNNINTATPTNVLEITSSPNVSNHKTRTVTCYQCSLCRHLSPTLSLLRMHLRQHDEQHSDLILMCSECCFTSQHQGELEAHIRLHFDDGGTLTKNPPLVDHHTASEGKVGLLRQGDGARAGSGVVVDAEVLRSSMDSTVELQQKKKWYSYEEYGLYRCLICSYVCSQQRMLKTHAWKHAGLVDCSYPIFEDEDEASTRREAQGSAGIPTNTTTAKEEVVVFSPVIQDKSLHSIPATFKLQLCTPLAVETKGEVMNQTIVNHNESPSNTEEDEEGTFPLKGLTTEEPIVEVQVTTEAESEVEIDSHHSNTLMADSLLSSAQKIINSSPNSAGHINVIVERLPTAEDSVMATSPLILSPDIDEDKSQVDAKEEEIEHALQHQPVGSDREVKEDMIIDWSDGNSSERQKLGTDIKPLTTINSELPHDENMPPAGRRRTHSESLRLHSLAAEALVTMPMRTPELHTPTTSACCSNIKASLKTIVSPGQGPNTGQGPVEVTSPAARAFEIGTDTALVDLTLQSQGREEGLNSLGLGLGVVDEEEPATKAGISLSLLTVIERLRERSDQNASDEDILKELQDNAQFQNNTVTDVVAENGARDDMCGVDGVVAAHDGGLVDYIPGSERPYRCRLCRYSSGNKGYIKQHLRVHRQRQPYQCPICDHIATDSKDLESHMIHHCKTRMYQCKQCSDAFHYKSQLRIHEREHHCTSNAMAALAPVTKTMAIAEEVERVTDEEYSVPKVYKCDVCDYTSSTYVGVRNHRRIHNSDKPYRCCSCDFATTNMNSLKSHMRRHPQEHQAVQLLEQYRCTLCGYVCSHPPSLKSHMWKHAGDQNYNYEQVNKAINEAISQSSRAPQKPSAVLEPVAERLSVAQSSKDKIKGLVDPLPVPTPTSAAGLEVDSSVGLPLPTTDSSQWPSESSNPLAKDTVQSQSQLQFQPQGRLRTGPTPGASMEYCVLLFCCCICGFESTSKERLMEHMKDHEGDIISIILNKEQQQTEPQPGLQTAKGSAAQ